MIEVTERADLTMAMNELLRQVPLFKSASQAFVKSLGDCLSPVVYDRGQALFHAGEDATCMYFIMDGEVQHCQSAPFHCFTGSRSNHQVSVLGSRWPHAFSLFC